MVPKTQTRTTIWNILVRVDILGTALLYILPILLGFKMISTFTNTSISASAFKLVSSMDAIIRDITRSILSLICVWVIVPILPSGIGYGLAVLSQGATAGAHPDPEKSIRVSEERQERDESDRGMMASTITNNASSKGKLDLISQAWTSAIYLLTVALIFFLARRFLASIILEIVRATVLVAITLIKRYVALILMNVLVWTAIPLVPVAIMAGLPIVAQKALEWMVLTKAFTTF